MSEPLFPIHSQPGLTSDVILVIEPYRFEDAWVFDDPAIGLVREPFVAGINEMIDDLTGDIPDAANGFRLQFAPYAFDGHQTSLSWIRTDPVEGNWYRSENGKIEGWLCPALFFYFSSPPSKIYLRADSK